MAMAVRRCAATFPSAAAPMQLEGLLSGPLQVLLLALALVQMQTLNTNGAMASAAARAEGMPMPLLLDEPCWIATTDDDVPERQRTRQSPA